MSEAAGAHSSCRVIRVAKTLRCSKSEATGARRSTTGSEVAESHVHFVRAFVMVLSRLAVSSPYSQTSNWEIVVSTTKSESIGWRSAKNMCME